MTLHELSRNIRMNEELERNTEMLEHLKTKAYSAPLPNLSGMPRGGEIHSRPEMFAVEITDLEGRIAFLKKEIENQRRAISQYCDSIEDVKIRNVFRMRFLHCMSWKEVAYMTGRSYSESGVKTMVYTYLNNNH